MPTVINLSAMSAWVPCLLPSHSQQAICQICQIACQRLRWPTFSRSFSTVWEFFAAKLRNPV